MRRARVEHHRRRAAEPAVVDDADRRPSDVSRVFSETVGATPPRLRHGDPRAALLLGAVLLDTQNLDASATRVHDRDRAVVPRLASLAGCGGDAADRFHAELKRRRLDQSLLSPRDLLRRDYKQWRFVPRAGGSATRAWDVGVASFGVPLAEMARDAAAAKRACAAFAREKRVDALALMLSLIHI